MGPVSKRSEAVVDPCLHADPGMSWRSSIPDGYLPNRFRRPLFVAFCMRPTKSLSGPTSHASARAAAFMAPLVAALAGGVVVLAVDPNPAPNGSPTWGHSCSFEETAVVCLCAALNLLCSRLSPSNNDT
jgi:hypothetical protein